MKDGEFPRCGVSNNGGQGRGGYSAMILNRTWYATALEERIRCYFQGSLRHTVSYVSVMLVD